MDGTEQRRRRNWVEAAGGLEQTGWIARCVKHLVNEQHMTTGHAIAVAVNAAKKLCSTGDLNWPGVQHANFGSRAEACKSVAVWERMKAAARLDGRRDVVPDLEARTIDVDVEDLDTRGRKLVGYAAVYGRESHDLGGFRERIAPGAFADVLDADVRCLLNHDPSQVLGRTRSGTLRLFDEERGLRFECDLPDSPLGENVREAVRRGDVDGASFRFKVAEDAWDGDLRTLSKVRELRDVTVATYAAYPDASVELRTRPNHPGEEEEPEVPDDRTGGGGLSVEDRTAAPNENTSIETRVLDAIRAVPKGEQRSLTEADNAAPVTPPELNTYLWDRLRDNAVVLSTGIGVITTSHKTIKWPRLVSDVQPDFVDELEPIPESDPGFDEFDIDVGPGIKALTRASSEALDDSDPDLLTISWAGAAGRASPTRLGSSRWTRAERLRTGIRSCARSA